MRVVRVPLGADPDDTRWHEDVSLFSLYIMKYPVNACSVNDALNEDDIRQIRAHRRLVWHPVMGTGEPAMASEDPAEAARPDDDGGLLTGTDAVVLSWNPLRYAVNAVAARVLDTQLMPIEQSLVHSIRTLAETGLLRVRLPPGHATGHAALNAKDWLPDVELGPFLVATATVVTAAVVTVIVRLWSRKRNNVPATAG